MQNEKEALKRRDTQKRDYIAGMNMPFHFLWASTIERCLCKAKTNWIGQYLVCFKKNNLPTLNLHWVSFCFCRNLFK